MPEVRRALERPVLSGVGELGDLACRPRIFVEDRVHSPRIVSMTEVVTAGWRRTDQDLPEYPPARLLVYPGSEGFPGGCYDAGLKRCFGQSRSPAPSRGRGQL